MYKFLNKINSFYLSFLTLIFLTIFSTQQANAGCESTHGGSGDVTISSNCTSGYASTGDITSLVINSGVEVRWTGGGSQPVRSGHNIEGFINNGTIRST